MEKLKLTKQQKEVFTYLNGLSESGKTNMFGATPYIMVVFSLDEKSARNLLSSWMSNFNYNGYEDCEVID